MNLTRREFAKMSSLAGIAAASGALFPRLLGQAGLGSGLDGIESRVDQADTVEATLVALRAGWNNPPATYRPHTRWWWPGNAVTREGIDWQLEQMKQQGLGGVEIMSFLKIYEKGNIEFESPEFIAMVQHVVERSHELGLEVSLSLGPGWGLGGAQVLEANRSKVLVFSSQMIEDGRAAECAVELPAEPDYAVGAKKKLEAVVAVAVGPDGAPDPARRVDLTAAVSGDRDFAVRPRCVVKANLPDGRWKIMAFWTAYTGQKCAAENFQPRSWIVDHLKRDAVRDFVTQVGARYRRAFGADFGATVESFFGDSYELTQDFSLWSDGLFARFEKEKDYDLRPFLPLLIYDGAPETPYVRYDFGHFLHQLGMEAAIGETADYCEAAGIHMRQQPHYRFTVELIEAAGRLQRPETELSRRSFDPSAYPHKLTTSGAWLYPARHRRWVSCEAFTFLNLKYRTSMEEIKRATDLFLRDGITQFYNHGYFYTPEKELEPARDLLYMNRISHVNTWWRYYRGLADYQARAAFLSRQGRAEAQVLLYSPMPTVWSERSEYPCKHVRDVPFGQLPKILVANGYDFDCVNDDLLLNHATVENGNIVINGYDYAVLILPRVLCLAPETLRVVERFVRSGGTVFALKSLPERSPGLANHVQNDAALHALRDRLFAPGGGAMKTGRGTSYFLPGCDGFEFLTVWAPSAVEWEPTAPLSPAYGEFVQALRRHAVPDFEIADAPQSNGLTFRHTRIGQVDCWFICNLQPNRHCGEVTLNSRHQSPQAWDALTGIVTPLRQHRWATDGRIILPLTLEPWASVFVLLTPGASNPSAGDDQPATREAGGKVSPVRTVELSGPWDVAFQGLGRASTRRAMTALTDWSKIKELEDFSGTAVYSATFDVGLSEPVGTQREILLDLGTVHEVAAVRVNGVEAGTVWMQPYRLDISEQVRAGQNSVQIEVVNLLWNYATGLEKPTPIPAELQAHYGAAWDQKYNGWGSLQAIKRIKKNDRLPSGLIGPVIVRIREDRQPDHGRDVRRCRSAVIDEPAVAAPRGTPCNKTDFRT